MFKSQIIIAAYLLTSFSCYLRPVASQYSSDDKLIEEDNGSLQTCINAFDVHRNKIIRTQDSREMGAKYLTEYDVDSKHECMKWCCITDQCDVFVFDEIKKPSGCFLFHCGPPKNFKCKFTTHANYSSAVLTNYNLQSAVALEEEIHRTQQEQQLKSLRKELRPLKYASDPIISTISTTLPTQTILSTQLSVKLVPPCTQNQFKCQSTGECIAIYNVCDGISQCADDSDEAPKLMCHSAEKSTKQPSSTPPTPSSVFTQTISPKQLVMPLFPSDLQRYQEIMQQQNPFFMYPSNPNINMNPVNNNQDFNQQRYNFNSNMHQILPHDPVYRNYPSPDEIAAMNRYNYNNKPLGYQWNYPVYEINKNNELEVLPHQVPMIYKDQPHNVQIHGTENEDNGEFYKGQTIKPVKIQFQQPQIDRVDEPSVTSPVHHKTEEINDKKKQEMVDSVKLNNDQQIENKISKTSNDQILNAYENEKKLLLIKENKNSNKNLDNVQLAVAKDIRVADAKSKAQKIFFDSQLKERTNLDVADHIRRQNVRIEDLEYSSPEGAVISLGLGLSATAITAVLIACKLRVVKRRGRGRAQGFAHDADYLVNGMYL